MDKAVDSKRPMNSVNWANPYCLLAALPSLSPSVIVSFEFLYPGAQSQLSVVFKVAEIANAKTKTLENKMGRTVFNWTKPI